MCFALVVHIDRPVHLCVGLEFHRLDIGGIQQWSASNSRLLGAPGLLHKGEEFPGDCRGPVENDVFDHFRAYFLFITFIIIH